MPSPSPLPPLSHVLHKVGMWSMNYCVYAEHAALHQYEVLTFMVEGGVIIFMCGWELGSKAVIQVSGVPEKRANYLVRLLLLKTLIVVI